MGDNRTVDEFVTALGGTVLRARELPGEGSFDVVLLAHGVCGAASTQNRIEILRLARARLADGGRVVLETFDHAEHHVAVLDVIARMAGLRLLDRWAAPGPSLVSVYGLAAHGARRRRRFWGFSGKYPQVQPLELR
ncbi:hypothetical protein [Allokutzneria sp. NRRL B-24872]|uniref:hypothetical protein n=1 Tax=Allokutzneria sp. NRRL B-24872 TaxID=1137961 RepID=UPI000A360FD3|nr:hypothetical protein [Allokutzneria sp. NRRL B-24872]